MKLMLQAQNSRRMISKAKRPLTQEPKPLLCLLAEHSGSLLNKKDGSTSNADSQHDDEYLSSLKGILVSREVPIKIVLETYLDSKKPPKLNEVPLLKAALALLWKEDSPTSQLIKELGAVSKTTSAALCTLNFLEFLAREAKTGITISLSKTYDDSKFINNSLINPLVARVESLAEFREKLEAYLANGAKIVKSKGETRLTVPRGPLLTKVRVPKILQNVEEASQKSSMKHPAITKYTPLKKEPSIPVKLQKTLLPRAVIKKASSECSLKAENVSKNDEVYNIEVDKKDSTKALYSPQRPSTASRVRKVELPRATAATVLRDHALIARRDQEAQKVVTNAVCSLVDTNSIAANIERAKTDAEAAEQVAQARRRMKVMILREDAQISRENAFIKKTDEARVVKEKNEALAVQIEQRAALTEAANREVVAAVQEGLVRVQEAKSRVQEENYKAAREEAAKITAALQEAALRQREEMEARRELIRQIRALEQVGDGVNAGKFNATMDDTITAGYGLLAEMSIAELRLRLECVKHENEILCEARRAEIAAHKAQKSAELQKCRKRLEEVHRFIGPSSPKKNKGAYRETSEIQKMKETLMQRKSELKKIVLNNAASPRRFKVRIKRALRNPLADYSPPKSKSDSEMCRGAAKVKLNILATASEPAISASKAKGSIVNTLSNVFGVEKAL